MAAEGVEIIEPMERLSAMGLVEAVRTLPKHLRLLRRLKRYFAAGRYKLAVLIDYPGFHLRVAAAAAASGLPVLYYIAPQLWAWGKWRARSVRKNVRSMAVVLPFEKAFFQSCGIPVEFVGHPLLDRPPQPSCAAARRAMGLDVEKPVLGLFPGSRTQEIDRMWPTFREAARHLRQAVPQLQTAVAATAGDTYSGGEGLLFWRKDAASVFAAADAVLCKSGTATLEAALSDTPMVIAYRMHPLTYAIARRAVRLSRVGLVNLLAGRDVAPEYLQRDARPQTLATAIRPLLDPAGVAATRQREAFAQVRVQLGSPGAGRRVAEMARRLVA